MPDYRLKEAREALRHDNVKTYRTLTIKSGDVLEIETFPIWNTRSEYRTARENLSSDWQVKLNEKNAIKNFIRKVNCNFSSHDYSVALTYNKTALPNEEKALRDLRNFLRKARNYHKKQGLPALRYMATTESLSKGGLHVRIHHHIIMSGGIERQALKNLWTHGRVRVDELEPVNGSLEGLAKYITANAIESKQGRKRFTLSRNLKKPIITRADGKYSKRQVERMLLNRNEAQAIFERQHPKYIFDSCDYKRSPIVSGAYVYVKMFKLNYKEIFRC